MNKKIVVGIIIAVAVIISIVTLIIVLNLSHKIKIIDEDGTEYSAKKNSIVDIKDIGEVKIVEINKERVVLEYGNKRRECKYNVKQTFYLDSTSGNKHVESYGPIQTLIFKKSL